MFYIVSGILALVLVLAVGGVLSYLNLEYGPFPTASRRTRSTRPDEFDPMILAAVVLAAQSSSDTSHGHGSGCDGSSGDGSGCD